jgi:hypothetical protein
MNTLTINLPDHIDADKFLFWGACLFIEKFDITLKEAAIMAKLSEDDFRERYKSVKNSRDLIVTRNPE